MAQYCIECGSPLRDDARFCPKCGTSVTEQPKPEPSKCAYCGAELKATSKFCSKCGRTVITPIVKTAPTVQNETMSHMQQQAAQCGVKAATPINNAVYARQQLQPQTRQGYQQPPQYPPQYQLQYQPQAAKKRLRPLAVIIPVVAVVLAAAILFTGLVAPGWMKGAGGVRITPIYSDNSYVEVAVPDYNKETKCVNTVSSLAIQAQLNAMLTEEKFYRAVDEGKSIEALRDLCEQNKKAWETADVLSSASYMMGMALRKAEKNSDYKSTAALTMPKFVMTNPFVLSTSALEMDYFDNAKEWAEYITRVYDHAKAGSKTAYVAKILKTDVKRAQKSIEMAQAILWGEGESQAHNDSATLTVLQTTKTAGKIAGVAGATIATGGVGASLSGSLLSTGGYIASSADMIMEVGDTTLQLTLGEDHQVTKTYQEAAAKVAPIVSIVSFAAAANPGSWEKGIDAVGNVRYIVDSTVDMVNGKIFGIECPLPEDGGVFKILTIPTGENATPEDIEKAAQALSDMGFDKEAVKQALTLPEENDEDEEPEPAEKPFSELSDEELEQKLEYTSLTEEEWQALFQEVYDEYLEEMNDKGLIDPYDDIWDYDPFMPIEDFPEDGDELGFDDIANWAKPDMPYEESGDNPDDEGEPAQPGDDEGFDNPDTNGIPMSDILGLYPGTIAYSYIDGHGTGWGVPREGTFEFYLKDGKLYAKAGNRKLGPIDYDAATGTAAYTREDNTWPDGSPRPMLYEFHFIDDNGTLSFSGTMKDLSSRVDELGNDDAQMAEYHGVKTDEDDVMKYKGNYVGTCTVTNYYSDGARTEQEEKNSVGVQILKDGRVRPWNFGHGQAMVEDTIEWDPKTASGKATETRYEYSEYDVSWHFEESDGQIKLFIDVYEPNSQGYDIGSDYLYEAHYELIKEK